MRILLFTNPYRFLLNGMMLRTYKIFKNLSHDNDIYLVSFINKKSYSQNYPFLQDKFFKNIFFLDMYEQTFSREVLLATQMIISSYIPLLTIVPSYQKYVEKEIKKIIEENEIEILHINSLYKAFLVDNISGIPKVLDLIDSFGLRYLREAEVSKNPIKYLYYSIVSNILTKYEQIGLNKNDLTTVVSTMDMNHISKCSEPTINIKVIPTGVDIDNAFNRFNISKLNKSPIVMFLGNMEYSPNIESALYVYKFIMPYIWDEIPEVKYYIVGNNPDPKLKILGLDKNVIVSGFVKNIRACMHKSDVILVPMIKGSGIKTKILEAMSLGKAIVTNQMGAEWLEPKDRGCISIGKNSLEMAHLTIELLKNPYQREQLGIKALELIKEKYTWDICAKKYEICYKELLAKNKIKGDL
jgi:polysaccharide biosynthesis protein PslH